MRLSGYLISKLRRRRSCEGKLLPVGVSKTWRPGSLLKTQVGLQKECRRRLMPWSPILDSSTCGHENPCIRILDISARGFLRDRVIISTHSAILARCTRSVFAHLDGVTCSSTDPAVPPLVSGGHDDSETPSGQSLFGRCRRSQGESGCSR